jgi:hypothetical protein
MAWHGRLCAGATPLGSLGADGAGHGAESFGEVRCPASWGA